MVGVFLDFGLVGQHVARVLSTFGLVALHLACVLFIFGQGIVYFWVGLLTLGYCLVYFWLGCLAFSLGPFLFVDGVLFTFGVDGLQLARVLSMFGLVVVHIQSSVDIVYLLLGPCLFLGWLEYMWLRCCLLLVRLSYL